jgi:hypothetical protein
VDYDNNGFLDLFVTRDASGPNLFYRNNGNSNAWLKVNCVGTVSNRSAIGAKVRVRVAMGGKTVWQLREVKGVGGWDGVPLAAHFGLGEATIVDFVRVEWPSGTVQEFSNLAVNQFLTVTEPPRLLVSSTKGSPSFALQGGHGLPYQVMASDDLRTWNPLAEFIITNLNGIAQIKDTNALIQGSRFYQARSSR